ncbi:hypothetical protein VP01_1156g1 [Puccinia sorghi]|uniref:Uncharacterized protein n=1 Tax=Puccinia sorghi TaxID=27349 RepID=A0A0L6VRN2_9BASI|nr:hypothetical protein VP01_1156g1 [Puccinia sorghi]
MVGWRQQGGTWDSGSGGIGQLSGCPKEIYLGIGKTLFDIGKIHISFYSLNLRYLVHIPNSFEHILCIFSPCSKLLTYFIFSFYFYLIGVMVILSQTHRSLLVNTQALISKLFRQFLDSLRKHANNPFTTSKTYKWIINHLSGLFKAHSPCFDLQHPLFFNLLILLYFLHSLPLFPQLINIVIFSPYPMKIAIAQLSYHTLKLILLSSRYLQDTFTSIFKLFPLALQPTESPLEYFRKVKDVFELISVSSKLLQIALKCFYNISSNLIRGALSCFKKCWLANIQRQAVIGVGFATPKNWICDPQMPQPTFGGRGDASWWSQVRRDPKKLVLRLWGLHLQFRILEWGSCLQ